MKILYISLGCDKNLVDSEHMLGILSSRGYEFTDSPLDADIIIINSCAFIKDAQEETIDTIFEMAQYKKSAHVSALVLTGCMSQRYRDEISDEIPEIDVFVGTTAIDAIADALDEFFQKNTLVRKYNDINAMSGEKAPRISSSPGSYAYLKIADGCGKHCTYCAIPNIRGQYRSVPMEDILREARELAASGKSELILVAQETTLYGTDIYGKKTLHILLQKLAQIPEVKWIRVLYCYPEEIYDELIGVIASEKKICHYLDIPVQHASDEILRRMGRHTTENELRRIIEKLRNAIPDIALRTTLITGFPGETERDFDRLLSFVSDMKFDRLGVFTYSPEEGTAAKDFDNQIPESIKKERRDAVMKLQQDIIFKKSRKNIGRIVDVMIDGKLVDEPVYVGRTYMDTPDVDSNIFIPYDGDLIAGEVIRSKITGVNDYDLIGEAQL